MVSTSACKRWEKLRSHQRKRVQAHHNTVTGSLQSVLMYFTDKSSAHHQLQTHTHTHESSIPSTNGHPHKSGQTIFSSGSSELKRFPNYLADSSSNLGLAGTVSELLPQQSNTFLNLWQLPSRRMIAASTSGGTMICSFCFGSCHKHEVVIDFGQFPKKQTGLMSLLFFGRMHLSLSSSVDNPFSQSMRKSRKLCTSSHRSRRSRRSWICQLHFPTRTRLRWSSSFRETNDRMNRGNSSWTCRVHSFTRTLLR